MTGSSGGTLMPGWKGNEQGPVRGQVAELPTLELKGRLLGGDTDPSIIAELVRRMEEVPLHYIAPWNMYIADRSR